MVFTFLENALNLSIFTHAPVPHLKLQAALREKCLYSELFWSVFSRIRTEYGEIRSIKFISSPLQPWSFGTKITSQK